ncbi:MAG: hypothetical protein PHO08_11540 [Methylococcales bacterium]|nr:hypothetical protein [Methylococcales bacterium]
MKKTLEAKPTILRLIRKTKVCLVSCILLAFASQLVTAYALPHAERHVYAKVLVDGVGVKYGDGYMRDVYLDVVTVPSEIVIKQESGILFTEGNYKKSLSEIHARVLEFVEPHIKELGFDTVSDYQVFIYPGDKDTENSDREAVEKLRVDSFRRPSMLSGPKAELHGDWIGSKAGSIEAKPLSLDEKTATSGKSSVTGNEPTLVLTQKSASANNVENTEAEAQKMETVDEAIKKSFALEIKQAEEENAKADKKAKLKAERKAERKVEKEMIFDDSLEESQAKTWCKRIVPEYVKSTTSSDNKLISMGECSCKPSGESESLQKKFHCGFQVTYRKSKVEEEKAKADKKIKLKAKSKVIKERIFDDSLEESQAKTWCKRIVPEFVKSMSSSNNKLIRMGECSCKPEGESESLQQEFRCGFAVTYRVFTSNEK